MSKKDEIDLEKVLGKLVLPQLDKDNHFRVTIGHEGFGTINHIRTHSDSVSPSSCTFEYT